jgi:predicted nucleic acid-binding protein
MNLTEGLESVHQIFLDTAPVIYFVEKNPIFAAKVQNVFQRLDDGKLTAVVSAQIFTDLMVKSESVMLFPIDEMTAEKAAELRARYGLTLADAFQFAVAIQSACDAFLTNDADLKRVVEIPVIVVSE